MEVPQALHWLREPRRRHLRRVFRAVVTYGVVAFALVEVFEPVMHALHLPEWTLTLFVVLLGFGFPVVAVIAWISAAAEIADSDRTDADARAGEAGQAATGTTRSPSIAVLPFVDMSPLKDQEYFADGVAEEILNALAHIDGLRVPGRTSSFFFKGKSVRPAEIGRDLDVAALLEGSVRKDGNRVRVTAQVLDVAGGCHLWSETYDRELTGIFEIQDEIARAVANALKVKLLPGGAIVNEKRTTTPDAYNEYLLGRHCFDLGTSPGMSRAVTAFEKAASLDAGYAPAWAWLSVAILNSNVYLSRTGSLPEVDAAIRRALDAAERAVAVAPDLADCWSARGWMRTCISWDWAGARDDFERALALNSRGANILVRKGHLLAILGQLPEAISITREVIAIDPLWAWAWYFLASYYNGSGQPALAREAATRALEIAPEHIHAIRELGVAHLLEGQPASALAVFERHSWDVIRLAGTVLAQHDLGNAEAERNAMDALCSRFGEGEAYEIALIHAWRGDRDAAFGWLDRAVGQRGGVGVSRLHFRGITFDPLLRNVRRDPRYPTLLQKMRLPADDRAKCG